MDHDHSDHDTGHTTHVMHMWFFFSRSSTVLFEGWTFSTTGGLIGSMIGIFFLALLYEGLKYFRAILLPIMGISSEEKQAVKPTMLSKIHFIQTILQMIQMILSYFLMLIFMTYNGWLCIAVVLGGGLGYFLFGWKNKAVIVDVTEHCH